MVKNDYEIESMGSGEKQITELGGFRTSWTCSHVGQGRWVIMNSRGQQVFEGEGGFDAVFAAFTTGD